jgi:HSP20 family protein
VSGEKVEAHYEDGVLNLYLPKIAAAKPRTIEIQAKNGGFFDKMLGNKKDVEVKPTSSSH